MKKLWPFISLLMLILSVPVLAQQTIDSVKKLDIYYFHGQRRCPTCLAVEQATQDLLNSDFKKELDAGVLKFTALNYEKPESQALVQKYAVWGSALLIVNNRGEMVDLTEKVFRTARHEPEQFRDDLRSIIHQQLRVNQ
jgi:hypothetical protein